jgi:hypothetical protein
MLTGPAIGIEKIKPTVSPTSEIVMRLSIIILKIIYKTRKKEQEKA